MASNRTTQPVNYGVLLFPGFQLLDVCGPLDILNTLAISQPLNLCILSSTLDPVTTSHPQLQRSPSFSESLVPTHTFANPPDLDVLLIPGGLGTRSLVKKDDDEIFDFIKKVYPKLQYLLTVCTGSAVLAKTGLLNGKIATSNKAAFKWVKGTWPEVKWVAKARWAEDGNIWTSSGVSAGMDLTFAFVSRMYGEEEAADKARILEYDRHMEPSWDPFAAIYGLED